jgi:hypothetical protein
MASFTAKLGSAEQLRTEREAMEAESPFVAAADGRIPSQRLEAYLRVRRALAEPCSDFEGFFGAIEEMESRDGAESEPSFREGLALAAAGMKLPGILGDYYQARNGALLAERMSLEEWRWYTVLAYRSAQGSHRSARLPEGRAGGLSRGGDQELVRRTLVAQLEAARAAGPEQVSAEWLELLEAEVGRLEEPRTRGWPWPETLPDAVAESLSPFADELRATHCPHAEQFEFEEVQQDGVSIRVQ